MVLPTLSDVMSAADRISPVLLSTAARSLIILSLVGLAAVTLRRASAAVRHWLWLVGIISLLLLPVLAMLPGWRVLPRMDRSAAAMTENASRSATVMLSDAAAPGAPVQSRTIAANDPAVASVQAPSQGGGRLASADRVIPRPSSIFASIPWTSWLVTVWLIGMSLMLGHVLLGFISLWLLQRRCSHLRDGEWASLLSKLRQELRVRSDVKLLSSPLRTMPMTWGIFRARLLVPQQAANWPTEQRRSVLLHELGHVRRFDCLTQLLAQFACAIYWFNPLVWIGWHRMQVERERACDDLVLNSGGKASSYAEHLLQSAAAMPAFRFIGPAVAMARPSTLEERLRAILDPRGNRRAMSRGVGVLTILLLMGGLIPVAVLRAQPAPVAPTPAPAGNEPDAPSTPSPSTRPALTRGSGSGRGPARGGGGFSGAGASVPMRGAPTGSAGEGPTCSLDATIYEVRLPAEKIGRLDADALDNAASNPESFEKALGDLGTLRPLYRANQSVRLTGDSIMIGTNMPYVTNSQTTAKGDVINTVMYSNTGANFSIAGKSTASNSIELDLNIQVSTLSEGNTQISADVKAPIFHTVSLSRKGPVAPRTPFVVISVDAATADPSGKAVAYIARVTLGKPDSNE